MPNRLRRLDCGCDRGWQLEWRRRRLVWPPRLWPFFKIVHSLLARSVPYIVWGSTSHGTSIVNGRPACGQLISGTADHGRKILIHARDSLVSARLSDGPPAVLLLTSCRPIEAWAIITMAQSVHRPLANRTIPLPHRRRLRSMTYDLISQFTNFLSAGILQTPGPLS